MNLNNKAVANTINKLKAKFEREEFVIVRGQKTVELLNWTGTFNTVGNGFITLPGFSTSEKYVNAELAWYDSASAKADFISNFAQLWGDISDDRNFVNSNYGQLIYSPQNCYQFDNVVKALKGDQQSRRAVMVYCPPHIHYTGGNDYVCTMYTSYTIRDNELNAFVSMRSCDLRFGLVGADLAWQIHVLKELADKLGVKPNRVHWHAVSLHLYERHFEALK